MSITVSELHIYPVKSCAPLDLQSMTLDRHGPIHDRRWMVVQENDGELHFVSQREQPRLALVRPQIAGGLLMLTAPGMSALAVPLSQDRPADRVVHIRRDTIAAAHVSDEASRWFSDWLGERVSFVRMPEDEDRIVNPVYTRWTATTTFTDGYPVLLISRASLNALNDRMAERALEPVSMQRFRPNIVVAGCLPFAEDSWTDVRIGDVRFHVAKPCPRCVMTTVDPVRGIIDDPREPLATLSTFRRTAEGKVMFGQNLVHASPGTLTVGDSLEILESVLL
jgi:hypothetical protein